MPLLVANSDSAGLDMDHSDGSTFGSPPRSPIISRLCTSNLELEVREDEEPSAEQVIDWIKEEAFRRGKLEFDLSPKCTAEFSELIAGADCLNRQQTLEDFIEADSKDFQKAELKMKIIENHPAVVMEATRVVEEKLLEAGMSITDHSKFLRSIGIDLRRKVVKLYELVHPRPAQPLMIHIKLCRQSNQGTRLEDVWVRAEDSLVEVVGILYMRSLELNSECQEVQTGFGPWSYDLMVKYRDREQVQGQRRELFLESDWRLVVREMTREGSKLTGVMFVQARELRRGGLIADDLGVDYQISATAQG